MLFWNTSAVSFANTMTSRSVCVHTGDNQMGGTVYEDEDACSSLISGVWITSFSFSTAQYKQSRSTILKTGPLLSPLDWIL